MPVCIETRQNNTCDAHMWKVVGVLAKFNKMGLEIWCHTIKKHTETWNKNLAFSMISKGLLCWITNRKGTDTANYTLLHKSCIKHYSAKTDMFYYISTLYNNTFIHLWEWDVSLKIYILIKKQHIDFCTWLPEQTTFKLRIQCTYCILPYIFTTVFCEWKHCNHTF